MSYEPSSVSFAKAEHEYQMELEDADIQKSPDDLLSARNKLRAIRRKRIKIRLERVKALSQNNHVPTAGAKYGNGKKDQFKKL